jgi:hypothetical protein
VRREGGDGVPSPPSPLSEYPSIISCSKGGALGLGRRRSPWAEDGAALVLIAAAASHASRTLEGGGGGAMWVVEASAGMPAVFVEGEGVVIASADPLPVLDRADAAVAAAAAAAGGGGRTMMGGMGGGRPPDR